MKRTLVTVLALILLGSFAPAFSKRKPKIADKSHVVKFHYTGKLKDGRVFDSSFNREPMQAILGNGQLITGFEKALIGMKKGESKTVELAPQDAYGEYQKAKIIEVPKENLPKDLELKEGAELMMNTSLGQAVPVRVVSVGEENVFLDTNHFLAGKELVFDLELVSIDNPK